jgi:hypothetical protein
MTSDNNAFRLNTDTLPRSSPPSSLGDSEDEDELPKLEALADSDSDNDESEQLGIHSHLHTIDSGKKVCKGQRVQWTPGSVWDTFPYQQHADDTIGWRPYLLDNDNNDWIRLKSTKCKENLNTILEIECEACSNCQKVINTPSFQMCMKRAAGDAAAHTPWKYLTLQQMRCMLVDNRKAGKSMRFTVGQAFNLEEPPISYLNMY